MPCGWRSYNSISLCRHDRTHLVRGAVRQPDRVLPLYAGKVHVGQLSWLSDLDWNRSGAPTKGFLMPLLTSLPAAPTTSVATCLAEGSSSSSDCAGGRASRIRREIHDGIGPLLAAALLRTETAMDLPPGCPSQAESLQKLHNLQKSALIDVRSLVEGLRPPALDNEGLLGALSNTRTQRCDGCPGPPTISFEVAGDPSVLPAAVEVAAYASGRKRLATRRKHAGATSDYCPDESCGQRSHA
jgi:hypothetical protein